MNKKLAIVLTIVAVGLFALVAFFSFRNDSQDKETATAQDFVKQGQKPVYLFTHKAGAGTTEKIDDDTYLLNFSTVDPKVVYFSDRPARDVGRVALPRFLDTLGFEAVDPPNAAVTLTDADGNETQMVVELTDPLYNHDEKTLTYKAKFLRDDQSGTFARYGTNNEDIVVPESFVEAQFFIDGCAHKNEIFCGSLGRCIDSATENCDSAHDAWEKHKDKKCHGMKLEDAYKIAGGKESECLLYDRAILTNKFACDDDIKGWRIEIDAHLKGEAAECKAYCIVPTKEKHSEGVGRVEYVCDKKKEEKSDKNTFCVLDNQIKGHDDKDAQKHLIKKYEDILKKVKESGHTSYEHHYCITTGMPYPTGKHWATDCSGLGGYALYTTLPMHYKELDKTRGAYKKADRPLAQDFYEFINKQKTEDNGKKDQCWMKVAKLKDAKKGDFLVVKYDSKAKKNSTGHVMWIDDIVPPKSKNGERFTVTVIDSANNGHSDDTRHANNTFNCESHKDCGIGRGKMYFYTNDNGEPIAYRWRASTDSKKYIKYKKDCDKDKDICELEGIVVGRVLDCKK